MQLNKNTFKLITILASCFLYACGSDSTTSSTSNSNPEPLTPDENTNSQIDNDIENVDQESDAPSDPIIDPIAEEETLSPETTPPLPEVDNRDWQKAKGWTNFEVEEQIQGIVTISFDVRATENNINGVAAVTSGMAEQYNDLALIFRMNMDGFIDARDGDTYQSESTLAYIAGDIYTVVMDIDFNSRLYDIFVTYPDGQRFPVRLSASFRETQPITSANQLVIYEALNDQLEISNFQVNNHPVYLVENTEPEPEQESNIADPNTPLVDPDTLSFEADAHFSHLPRIEVGNSNELRNTINSNPSGARIYVRPGTYGCLDLSDRNYSQEAPLLIEGLGQNNTDTIFNGSNCSHTIEFNNSSYIRVKNVSTRSGLDGVSSYASNNIIIDDLDISQPRQGGIHIGHNSSDIDIINNHIYNTGIENSQWGECIYIGTGASNNFPDVTVRVWIENNHIHNCGYGEGINIKPEVFHTTAKANYIHNIRPGNPNHSQYNHAAITVEPGRGSDYRPNDSREIWVENNVIENVTRGRWAYGIMSGGTGNYIVGNTISSFEEAGIWTTNYNNLGSSVYIFGNSINTNTQGSTEFRLDSGVDVITNNPPISNPNEPLDWISN